MVRVFGAVKGGVIDTSDAHQLFSSIHEHIPRKMTVTRASTSYKKQDGTLLFDVAKASVSWSPLANGKSQTVTIAVTDITNLQQTPATSAKCALKIVVQPSTAAAVENHVFNFTSTTSARQEQEAITDSLRNAISATRAAVTNPAAPGPSGANGDGQPAALAMASAASSSAKAAESWYDDQKLKTNLELQRELLVKDPALRERFEESFREKPESITSTQFAMQFWGARLHLLRAHAIEKSQSQGAYNVLAEVKPYVVDNITKINLSKEQVQLIFNQHPLVKHVYNEVVPKLSEIDFWTRFFVSRLFKKLKGERITDIDSRDAVLDKYLDINEETLRKKQVVEANVPHFIDLEGNEQNHSQRQGNRPDFDMRPNTNDKVPILRVLNNMSEKMLSRVAAVDGGMHMPVGMDEETFNQLRLRDLQADSGEDRVILNIKDQRHLFAGSRTSELSAESRVYAEQDPNEVLRNLNEELSRPIKLSDSVNLSADNATTSAATSQILALISQQRALLSTSSSTTSLPPTIMQSLLLTHSTTTEFLHYFWTLLLSQSSTPSAKKDLPSLLVTLTNSLARINAVATEAEKERLGRVGEAKRAANEYFQRTGKKRKVDEAALGGGKEEVEQLLEPTVKAIAVAREKYEASIQA